MVEERINDIDSRVRDLEKAVTEISLLVKQFRIVISILGASFGIDLLQWVG